MTSFDPREIANWTGGSWLGSLCGEIKGFCFDARRIQSGECFVALSGGSRDGHDFVGQAEAGGATALMVERQVDSSLPQLMVADCLLALGKLGAGVRAGYTKPVVGITGSCGKTSTKEMLRLLLGEDECHATAGNWNNRIGVPMTLLGLEPKSHNFAVIEAGINQPQEMQLLGEMIRADLTILTNIGPAHLELLGSLENIAVEKSQVACEGVMDSPIILPAEALMYPAFAELSERAVVLLPQGASEPALPLRDLIHYGVEASDCGQSHLLQVSGQSYQIQCASRGMAVNAALAITAALRLGVSSKEIRPRIEAWRPGSDRGRFEILGFQAFYVDCYNANPASMKDALQAFIRIVPKNTAKLFVLGAMNELGDFAEEAHQQTGQRLKLGPRDLAYFIGPDPLTAAYRKGALANFAQEKQVRCVDNTEGLKSIVADFEGAIFLKGSRSYCLEQLLPDKTK
jgi:UDP-N-acetylmuramoyl-tripeptide--D-alanyl-D-alanine ligase